MLLDAATRRWRGATRSLRRFVRNARAGFAPPISGTGLLPALRDYPAWRRALAGGSPLDDAQPWITFAAARFLRRIVSHGTRVFEWGSGGSTLFLANLGAKSTSIEHDPAWYARVAPRLAARLDRPELRLIQPAPVDCPHAADDPAQYGSSDPRFSGMSFEAYVHAIDRFADESFDLVLIDGRARPACIRRAIPKVRRGGWLVLDNADREHYARGIRLLDTGFTRRDFAGPIPYVEHFVCTSAWRKH